MQLRGGLRAGKRSGKTSIPAGTAFHIDSEPFHLESIAFLRFKKWNQITPSNWMRQGKMRYRFERYERDSNTGGVVLQAKTNYSLNSKILNLTGT